MTVNKVIHSCILIFATSVSLSSMAAPGDILFSEDFETNLAQWTIDNSGGGDASLGTETANSGSNSMRIRWDTVTATSNTISAAVPGAELEIWIRRGDDSFSENPDNNEDLTLEYFDNTSSWVAIETFIGNDTQGEIFDRTYSLPAAALHANLQIRLSYAQGSGFNFDYWHIDDVVVTETDPSVISGLIGEWRFDELFWNGSNNEVIDSSGNDLHLTAFSAQTSSANAAIAGDPGTCAYGVFNGSISFIQLNDDTSTTDSLLDIPDNLTVTTWINTNVIPTSGLKSILSKDENYEFHINTSGEIYWWWRWATLTTSGANITPGQWHHIAITWRSGEQVIYVDGVERARSSRTGTLDINNDPLQVGQDLDIAERFFDGFIDEVRIYENFLSAAEVNQVMNETHPCTTSGICSLTFEDNFPANSYDNSTGSEPWATDWLETDDDGSATSGNILISGGELQMDDRPNSGGEPAIERELDLSSYISAFISVDFSTSNNLQNGDRFDIAVSDNGGTSYTILESFTNDFSGTYNYDLTAFMAANTRIRFRVENGYGNNGERIDIDNVVITGQRLCGPDHFRIIHDGAGINCLREAITIRAEDASGGLVTDYSGTVDLSLSTNNGNWFVVDNSGASADPAQGTLTDTAGDNNGAATYLFDTLDGGSVVLYLEDTVAETANIGVAEGATTDDNSEGDITFRPFGFVFAPSPIPTQVAGKPFDITLTAAGQTPAQAECGIIEEYTGVKTVNFWSSYSLPLTSPTQVTVNSTTIATSEATSAPQNVTFSNGVATIATQYDDVGEISVHAKDEIDIGEPPGGSTDEIIGGISPFVVRPFGFDVQVDESPDPYADDSGDDIFRTAGDTFDMIIRSVLWESADDQIINATGVAGSDGIPDPFVDTNGDAIPDSGGDLSNNGVTPNIALINENIAFSPTALFVTNSDGNLSNTSVALTSFTGPGLPGEGTITVTQSWDEVGILEFDALNTDFMGGGENVIGQRTNIGRFIPANFLLSIDPIPLQCGTFSYGGFFDGVNAGLDKNGQLHTVSGNITARNLAGATTQNYAGTFALLASGDIALQAFDATAGANASGRVNFTPAALNFVNGTTAFSAANTDYQFDATIAPFDLRLDLTASDSDTVTSGTVNSNTFEVRLGRLRLLDSYGPEISDLEMRVTSEFFDGAGWITNVADSCTTYIQANATFDGATYTDNLNAGETAIFAPAATQALSNGISSLANGIWFSAPGVDNYGSVLVNLSAVGQGWLQFDWDGDNNLDASQASLNFGYYRGSDRVIYWREVRN